MNAYEESIEKIASGVIAQNASQVDKEGSFPRQAIDTLREAGFMALISAKEVGGKGEGPRAAALVIERIARECSSTAMVMCMHYAGTAVLEKFGDETLRKQNAAGEHLLTLAFSEAGSRSQFWAPVSSAKANGDKVQLDAKKSWVTSASHATAYIWSSQPMSAEGASTIWWVPKNTPGLAPQGKFDGLGLRGNDSTPVLANKVMIPQSNCLGQDGAGLSVMLETVLPIFNLMTSACAVGIMEAAVQASTTHASGTRYEHSDSTLADLPTIRAYLARMRIAADQARLMMMDTVSAMETGREDTMLRVLQTKATAGESATIVLDTAMRVCGGAAFRRDVGVERRFRDARAGTVMAPTTDQLYDFIGKAICGMPVF